MLNYNPRTGLFTWVRSSGNKREGDIAGNFDRYVLIMLDGKRYYAHRLAWLYVHGEWPEGEIDHINRNKHDNRIENLRLVTSAENKWNVGGAVGVSFYKRTGKWTAQMRTNGKWKRLGYFDSREAAEAVYRFYAEERLAGIVDKVRVPASAG